MQDFYSLECSLHFSLLYVILPITYLNTAGFTKMENITESLNLPSSEKSAETIRKFKVGDKLVFKKNSTYFATIYTVYADSYEVLSGQKPLEVEFTWHSDFVEDAFRLLTPLEKLL